LPVLMWMNAGMAPRKSSNVCSLMAALVERNGAQSNKLRHRSSPRRWRRFFSTAGGSHVWPRTPPSTPCWRPWRPARRVSTAIAGDDFGFLPHRFLKDGFLSALPPDALVLYVFLVLAANRVGVSFHRYDAICSVLGFHLERYLHARNTLIEGDLIAFDGTRFQVLSLPERPVALPATDALRTAADFEDRDPATIRALVLNSLNRDRK